jgi:hypothetical protein
MKAVHLPNTFDLIGVYTLARGFDWHLPLRRWQPGKPRVPLDLTGMTARLEIFDTQHSRRPPWVFSTASGHIVLGGAEGAIDIRLASADTQSITATACRYRLIFTDALGGEAVLLRGRLAVLGSCQ